MMHVVSTGGTAQLFILCRVPGPTDEEKRLFLLGASRADAQDANTCEYEPGKEAAASYIGSSMQQPFLRQDDEHNHITTMSCAHGWRTQCHART